MAQIQDLIARVQAMLDDPGGLNFATADYLMPMIRQISEEVFAKVAGYDVSFDEQRIVIQGVGQGTTDLSSYAQSGGQLEYLFNPMTLEFRLPGLDDTNWIQVRRYDSLPDQVNTQGITGWEYRSGVIYITPSTVAVDIRIRGEFLPAAITNLETPIMAGTMLTMAYLVAGLVGISRGNPQWIQLYGQKGEDALDALERKLVKQDQAITRRLGSAWGSSWSSGGQNR